MASPRRAHVVAPEDDGESLSPRRSRSGVLGSSTRVLGSGVLRSGVLVPGVTPDEVGTEAERDKNRRLLKDLYEEFRQFRDVALSRMDHLTTENGRLTGELEERRSEQARLANDLARSRNECSHLTDEVARVRGEHRSMLKDLRVEELRGAIDGSMGDLSARSEKLTHELDKVREVVRIQVGDANSKSDVLMGELNEVKMQYSAIKRELNVAKEQKSRLQEHQREIEQLKCGTRSLNDITRLEAKSDLAAVELQVLRRQLLERGVLMPMLRAERGEEEEEGRPPVGTIELGEDIFTARLLLRLGLMKGQTEAEEEDSLSSDGERSSMILSSSNVAGLVVPEVEEGTSAHFKLVYGWGGICSVTFLVQTLVLVIMLGHGLDMGEGECFEKPPPLATWLLLHASKALAMLVAGTLMGKELMDIANYWMVAELLMPKRCFEVVFTAALRVLMTITLIGANIAIFISLTNPAEVWLNMTALTFIGSLGEDVLGVAKRGVFGHPISKTMTAMNFQLSFVSEYPQWFAYVRTVTITIMASIVISFAYITFTSADPMCH